MTLKYFITFAFMFSAATQLVAQSLPDAITDDEYFAVDAREAALGQLLFYDPILSGNKTVACATCHHPDFGTSDGVSLSVGDGGTGLGPARRVDPNNPPVQSIPRNSPALFNLGARSFTVLFHDGRLEASADFEGGVRSPLDADMMQGFASVLSAQTMFPVLSRDEMAGSYDENKIGLAVRQGLVTGEGGAWDLLSHRVGAVPEYAALFQDVYPHIDNSEDIAFTDISNAIAAFIALEWRSDAARFDDVLRGTARFEGIEQRGMALFYGSAGCAACHSGPFLTDHDFHAMGAPQIGPGKSATFEEHQRDDGRFRVTGRTEDRYAFRTPSLRNVAKTAPYGHAGAHKDLAAFIAAHANPEAGLKNYDPEQAVLVHRTNKDFLVMNDAEQVKAIARAVGVAPVNLSRADIDALVAFLNTLTDPAAIAGRMGVPDAVPSGLPVP